MSRISSDAILDKFQNRLSGPALPTVPCILGHFKVHHALCDWGASTNILPKMVYDCLEEDPLVLTSQQLQLADSIVVQPYGITENVLIEFQDSSTLVDSMVMDMDPHQQTSIILGKSFLKSVRAIIDKTRGTINMKVDGVHEKFMYYPKNLACYCQIRVHRYLGSRKVRCVEVTPEHMRSRPQP
jgi:predicted DNA-binding ribbon-helix-helix protein